MNITGKFKTTTIRPKTIVNHSFERDPGSFISSLSLQAQNNGYESHQPKKRDKRSGGAHSDIVSFERVSVRKDDEILRRISWAALGKQPGRVEIVYRPDYHH